MKKKMSLELKTVISFFGITLLAIGIVFSYGRFNIDITGTEAAKILNLSSRQFRLQYDEEVVTGTLNNMKPGDSVSKIFSVSNIDEISGIYDLIWSDVTNTFRDRYDLQYTITCTIGDTGNPCQKQLTENPQTFSEIDDVEETFPFTGNNFPILTDVYIGSGIVHNYTLTVTFVGDDTKNQSDNINSSFSGKLAITNALTKDPNAYVTTVRPIYSTFANDENVVYDDATDKYYFTGANPNNYVSYGELTWRVVEFDTKGQLKLIADTNLVGVEDVIQMHFGNCDNVTTTAACPSYLSSAVRRYLEDTLLGSLIEGFETNYLINNTYTFYANNTDTFVTFESPIGVLSVDEFARAGLESFLLPNTDEEYWLGDVLDEYSIGLANADGLYDMSGEAVDGYVGYGIRPTIVLNPPGFLADDADGTIGAPYVIE